MRNNYCDRFVTFKRATIAVARMYSVFFLLQSMFNIQHFQASCSVVCSVKLISPAIVILCFQFSYVSLSRSLACQQLNCFYFLSTVQAWCLHVRPGFCSLFPITQQQPVRPQFFLTVFREHFHRITLPFKPHILFKIGLSCSIEFRVLFFCASHIVLIFMCKSSGERIQRVCKKKKKKRSKALRQ